MPPKWSSGRGSISCPRGKEEDWEGLLANGVKCTPVLCSGEVKRLAMAAQVSALCLDATT